VIARRVRRGTRVAPCRRGVLPLSLRASAVTIAAMVIVFEVFVLPGHDPSELVSEETLRDTGAQLMTVDEARAVGFEGVQADPQGREVRFVAVRERDAQRFHRVFEGHAAVAGYKMHEVDM
jgi:hypothetical protein